ncbi:unnamed protein product [Rotaria sp. Silwood2]|nr:unnamed protein product [Rotaria sp. Silwood2]CAF3573044.1 unnamed protein product [Rotaria sp. Silwood2]CAF4599399.1 unnamed protein product [Rotaria sp. Silwood2]CAF4627862.1 unnamed protein product [Rotaria sp. Silwood2]
MSTFFLATVNVHSFRTRNFDSNISDLVLILEPLKLDLIAVQEIQNDDKWQKFCKRLSLPYFIYGSCNEDPFGNGIASRYPIISYSNKASSLSCSGGTRSLLQCRLDGGHRFLTDRIFAVTHLDHLNEDDRLNQIKEFNPYQQNIDIIMGDMNSLTRDDYSDNYYQDKIVEIRKKSIWEEPRFDLTNLIRHEWNYDDAFRLINPTLKNEEVSTYYYGTRIDYIYLRPRKNDPWILTKCSIIDTKGATDHNAVFAEFKQKAC